MNNYSHPKWIERRNYILNLKGKKCTVCGSEKRVQVHHVVYRPSNEIWQYSDGELWPLCGTCHTRANQGQRAINDAMACNGKMALMTQIAAYNNANFDDVAERVCRSLYLWASCCGVWSGASHDYNISVSIQRTPKNEKDGAS